MDPSIPSPLKAVIGDIFSDLYSHSDIDARFYEANFPGQPPEGLNKKSKCHTWLTRADKADVNALKLLGTLLRDVMERVPGTGWRGDTLESHRSTINAQLEKLGLTYHLGGHIVQLGLKIASPTLAAFIKNGDLKGVEQEFVRIANNIDSDPAAAVTASCALLESLFETYIVDEQLEPPSDRSVLPLWKVVRNHLQLDPSGVSNENLRKILSGLASIVDGLAALRTKQGSAHGRDSRNAYRLEPRHARLAANGAATLATFVLEASSAKKNRR